MSNNTESCEHEQFKAVKAFISNCGTQFVIYNNNVHLAMLKENNTFICNPNPLDFKTLKKGEENDYYLDGVKCERVDNGDEEPVRDDEELVVRSDEESLIIEEEEDEPVLPLLSSIDDYCPSSSPHEPTSSKELLENATDDMQSNMFVDDAASVEREEVGEEEGIMTLRTDSSLITPSEKSDGNTISLKRKEYYGNCLLGHF
ncbi:unnamed protein product [Mucor hiemalis]